MKKLVVSLIITNIISLSLLIYILNTDYSITINNITYSQKIIDYFLEKD